MIQFAKPQSLCESRETHTELILVRAPIFFSHGTFDGHRYAFFGSWP
jgi:hypothetical protein